MKINYFNFEKMQDGGYVVTNDMGRYAFLSAADLHALLGDREALPEAVKEELTEKGFLIRSSEENFLNAEKYHYRDMKNYLFAAPSLHIFVVSNECNFSCVYCQANNGTKLHAKMDARTAEKAVDIALSSPSEQLTFEFQGGEPLTNFDAIRTIVEYTEKHKGGKEVTYNLVSNLTLLNEEILQFIRTYHVGVSTSIDGDEYLHDLDRPFADGRGTFKYTTAKVKELREAGILVGAIQTTTKQALDRSHEILSAYIGLGFSDIFIRPLTPLGCAKKRWAEIGYTEEEFLAFYRRAFREIIDLNLAGIAMRENYATLLLKKILTHHAVNYMELRSPCGGTLGQMAYYPNGDIFTCDEGRMLYEMGDPSFRLGNVAESTYDDLIRSKVTKTVCCAGILEAQPACCSCAYHPYCGTCPIINYALYGDVLPTGTGNYKCKVNKGIMDFLFSLLKENDEKTMQILRGWCER